MEARTKKGAMQCNNGTCAGIAGTTGCCFECDHRESCPDEIKCDDRAGFEAGTCMGREE